MGTEILVAGLWGAVFVYWLWTRRPTGDTVGLFHRELEVLQRATPLRVAPANRLGAHVEGELGEGTSMPPLLAAAAAVHKRAELRRRRRDVLSLLGAAALITILAAALSGSAIALAFQACADVALAGYLFLLYSAKKSHTGASFPTYFAPAYYPPGRFAIAGRSAPVAAVPGRALVGDATRFGRAAARREPRPRHLADSTGPMPAVVPPPPAGALAVAGAVAGAAAQAHYGDFDSYASLALVEAP